MSIQSEYLLVLTTCASEDEAARIAEALITEHAAACCNIVPGVRSLFFWQGKLEDGPETLVVIKTTAGAFPRVREAISKLHSYEVPEIIAVPIVDGSASYLDWVGEHTRP